MNSIPTTQYSSLDNMPVTRLKGVGPRVAERLTRLGIHHVQDLLFHLPLRYEDRTRIVPIGSLRPDSQAVIEGTVELTDVQYAKRRMLLSRISDGTGSITLRFFHFSAAQQASLAPGTHIRCYGEVRRGKATLEMIHPEYKRVDEAGIVAVEEHLTPIYPTTEGVHQLTLRALTDQALQLIQECPLTELLPADVLVQRGYTSLNDAVRFVHRPPPDVCVQDFEHGNTDAQRRLAFEELLAHQISMRLLHQRAQQHRSFACNCEGVLARDFTARLAFSLTAAQQRVIHEIRLDLEKPVPMQRLVQGDVGCGKTVVATIAALYMVESGYQVAVMAPTELLAEQHYANLDQWLQPLGVQLAWLSGKQKTAQRTTSLADIGSGSAGVVVGTHALFQEGVEFNRLGLLVIDEQHRFGVHQRMALREKGRQGDHYPHQLIMTATPIPRTLAMTAYADLDCSVIDELPPGRTPVDTVVIPEDRRAEVVERIHRACQQGRQVYWVCPLIDESEVLQCEAATETAKALTAALPELSIGLIHGRMKPRDKEQTMRMFKQGDLQLLVATTVIEVGVDVPNASLMVIENAERLGLSQLHQLRGRVGRGSEQSSCVLMYHAPLSQMARSRLTVMRETYDGFEVARKDLELRGPGEILGTRQTGVLQLHIADLVRDQAMLPDVARTAGEVLTNYPQHAHALVRRWIGDKSGYSNV